MKILQLKFSKTKKMTNNWEKLKGKQVKLLIEDTPFPKQKNGIIDDVDETHLWLKIINKYTKKEEIKPFSRVSIKRIDLDD